MSDNRAIGVFDSGLGGLTAVKEISKLLPNEDIVYFGDTGRVPYGTRSREIIIKYALEDIRFLLAHDVKLVVAACGTVSSSLRNEDTNRLPVPYTGVVEPTAKAACKVTRTGKIGIIGTPATIRSGSYVNAIQKLRPDIQVVTNSCPLLVPMVESGMTEPDNEIVRLTLEMYLRPFLGNEVDTLILGCTHYPLLATSIQRILGPNVRLLDAGAETARYVQNLLKTQGLASTKSVKGRHLFFVSDAIDGFSQIAKNFLGSKENLIVEKIEIESLSR